MKCLATWLMQKVHEAGDVGAVIVTTPEDNLFTIELQRPSVKRIGRINLRRNDPQKAAKLNAMFERIKAVHGWPEPDKEGGPDVTA